MGNPAEPHAAAVDGQRTAGGPRPAMIVMQQPTGAGPFLDQDFRPPTE